MVFEDDNCRDYLVPGDIHAVMAFTDVTGPFCLLRFMETRRAVYAARLDSGKQLSDETNASFIGMIDANAHADARGGKLSIDLMDTFLQNHDMRSCWREPTPTTFKRTLCSHRFTRLTQRTAIPRIILSSCAKAQFNSGKRLPEEPMHRIPSGIFPSDHAIVVVDIDLNDHYDYYYYPPSYLYRIFSVGVIGVSTCSSEPEWTQQHVLPFRQ